MTKKSTQKSSKQNTKTQTPQQKKAAATRNAHVQIAQRKKKRVIYDNIIGILAVIAIVAIGGTAAYSVSSSQATPIENKKVEEAMNAASNSSQYDAPSEANSSNVPDPKTARGKTYSVNFDTNQGKITGTLDGKKAPQAVSVIKSLADDGFYDGKTGCHRLVDDSIGASSNVSSSSSNPFGVLQCGDPKGDGTGGPEYKFGPVENAPSNDTYPAGTIAMARSAGDASSQGSQFFFVFKESKIPSDTAGGYSVIGQLSDEGLEEVKKLASQGTQNGQVDGKPKTDIKLTKVTVTENS